MFEGISDDIVNEEYRKYIKKDRNKKIFKFFLVVFLLVSFIYIMIINTSIL